MIPQCLDVCHKKPFWDIYFVCFTCMGHFSHEGCKTTLRHTQNPRLIQTFSEQQIYLVSFMHVIRYSRAIYVCSEPYLGRFKHIQNPGLFRHVMFYVYSGVLTKLHISRNICPHSGIFQQFMHIQNLCITGPTCVNQHLLFILGSSFKSLFNSILNIFYFCFKSKHSTFFYSGQYFNSNSNNNNSMPHTLARQPPHPRYHTTHTNTPLTPPVLQTLARQPPEHATHTNHTTHATSASTLPTPTRLVHQTRKHAIHQHTTHTIHTSTRHNISQTRFKSFLL